VTDDLDALIAENARQALLVEDYELDPTAEDGEPEAPDVRTDPVEDDPSATDEPVTED
jgi:hypothetical protein